MNHLALLVARRFRPRHVGIVLAGVMAVFLVFDLGDRHGFSSLRFFDLNDSDVAHRIGLAPVAIGGLFLGAAALALDHSTTNTRDPRAGRWFRASALLFAIFSIDEILGIHVWANEQGVRWSVSYLPFVAIATLTWFEMAIRFESRKTQRRCLVAVAAFLGASLFDAARAGDPHSYAAGELLEMGAGSLFVVSLTMRAHQYRVAEIAELGREGDLSALASFVHRLDPLRLAVGAAAVVVFLGVMGSVSHGWHYMRVFDVNKEQNYASMFSGLVLWAAALMAICNGVFRAANWRGRRTWVALGFVFLYLGLDEMTALHEEFQHVTGIWGQTFLLPVVAIGVVAWYGALMDMRTNQLAVVVWIAGASFWAVSQAIDLKLNGPMPWTTIPEELGEMTGSLLFAFSLLLALRALVVDSLQVAQARRTAASV